MKKFTVTLTKDERSELEKISSKEKHRSKKVLNALIFLGCDEGKYQDNRSIYEEISRVLNTSMRKIDRVIKRFLVDGRNIALNGRKGSRVYAKKVDRNFEA